MRIRSLFLKKSGALMASTILASTLALTTAPREAAAMDPGTIAATISIINTLKNMSATGGSGMAQRFEALDVKLDTILGNQANMIKAINEVQSTITDLRDTIPGMLTNSEYNTLMTRSHSLHNKITTLAARPDPFKDNGKTYSELLEELYDLSSYTKSTFETRATNKDGIGAILMAAPTLYQLAEATYLMAAIEQKAPSNHRWRDQRPQQYQEIVSFLGKGLHALATVRWQETFNEQQAIGQDAQNEIAQSPWAQVFGKMLRHNAPGNLKLDICFRLAARAKSVEEWVSTGKIRNMHMAPEFWMEEQFLQKTDFNVTDIKRFSLNFSLTELSPAGGMFANPVHIAGNSWLSPVNTWKLGYSVDGWTQAVKRQTSYNSASSNLPPGGIGNCVIGPVKNDELASSFNAMKQNLAIYSQQWVYLKDLFRALKALDTTLVQHAKPAQHPQPSAPAPVPGG